MYENEEKFEYIDWERKIQEHRELLEKEESERKDRIEKQEKNDEDLRKEERNKLGLSCAKLSSNWG